MVVNSSSAYQQVYVSGNIGPITHSSFHCILYTFSTVVFFTGAICRPLLICTDRSFMTTTCFPQCQKAKSVYSECSKAGKGEKKAVIGKKGKQDDHLNMSRRQSSKAFMAMRSLVHMKSDKIVLKKSLREKFKPRFLHCISDGVQSSDKRFIWSRLMPSM